MPTVDRRRVLRAMDASPWEFSNRLLYDLCAAHPEHTDNGATMAKVLIIGRVYAAAIERRKTKDVDEGTDRFYANRVAPMIVSSKIDRWIAEARSARLGTTTALTTMVRVHGLTTDLFHDISGLEKRALASKYLHFHVPNLFYIYDSRAAQAIREFSSELPRSARWPSLGDAEYQKFAEKCDALRTLCARRFSLRLLPRHVDNLLLRINER